VLNAREINGLRLFISKVRCATCHSGPLLSDQHFHNTGVPPLDRQPPERGRTDAVARVRADEFNCPGPYSDARPEQCAELRFIADDDPAKLGAFRRPGLRNVAQRAPYMHAGQLATLQDVVAHYAQSPPAAVGRSELVHAREGRGGHERLRLSAQEIADLVRFLGTLSGSITEQAP
jgi:cytochrome c peroxidase